MKYLMTIMAISLCLTLSDAQPYPTLVIACPDAATCRLDLFDKAGKKVEKLEDFVKLSSTFNLKVPALPETITEFEAVLLFDNDADRLQLVLEMKSLANLPAQKGILILKKGQDNNFLPDSMGAIRVGSTEHYTFNPAKKLQTVSIEANGREVLKKSAVPGLNDQTAGENLFVPEYDPALFTKARLKEAVKDYVRSEDDGPGKHILLFDFSCRGCPPSHIITGKKAKRLKGKNSQFIDATQELNIFFNNLPPFSDYDLTFEVSGATINQEGIRSFQFDLNAAVPQDTAEEPDKETGSAQSDGQTAKSESLKILEKYKQLGLELKQFYQDHRMENDVIKLQVLVNAITENISRALNISEVSGKSIQDKGLEVLSTALTSKDLKKDTDQYTAYLKFIEDAAKWYDQIVGAIYWPPFGGNPIQSNDKDIIKINWTLKENGKVRLSRPEPYELYVCNRWKWDVSLGLIGTNLVDHQYFLKPRSVIDTVISVRSDGAPGLDTSMVQKNKHEIIQSDVGDFKVGMGVLAHFYKKSCTSAFSPGFVLGTSVKFDEENGIKPRFLAGFGLSVGRKRERLAISAGVVYGPVKRLESSYVPGELLEFGTNQQAKVPLKNQWKDAGFFIGVTYNMLSLDN